MATVLLIIHIMIALALCGVVLLQRSEGGALGIGGGGGFMSGRGAANFLTRATAGLAAAFFATSLLLSILATRPEKAPSIFELGSGLGQQVAARAFSAGHTRRGSAARRHPRQAAKRAHRSAGAAIEIVGAAAVASSRNRQAGPKPPVASG